MILDRLQLTDASGSIQGFPLIHSTLQHIFTSQECNKKLSSLIDTVLKVNSKNLSYITMWSDTVMNGENIQTSIVNSSAYINYGTNYGTKLVG